MTVPLTGKHVLESLFEMWRPATLFKREPSIGVFLWILLPVSSYTEAIAQRCSAKKVFLEILQNSQENTSARVSFLIKLQASEAFSIFQLFSCEFCKISKNAFFTEQHWGTASSCFFLSIDLLDLQRCFSRCSRRRCFIKIGVLKRAEVCNYIKKETLAKFFPCKFCKIFKNAFVTKHIWPTGSGFRANDNHERWKVFTMVLFSFKMSQDRFHVLWA